MNPILWIIVGIVLCIAEIFHPAMILFPIGLSAITTGVFGLLIEIFTHTSFEQMIIAQSITFILVSAINIFILRKIAKQWSIGKSPRLSQPEDAIVGKEVYAKQTAKAHSMIEVEAPSPILGINLWHAEVLNDVEKGDKLRIVGHKGGILVCKKE